MSVDFWVGGLFVLISAADRFNTPPSNRSSTTLLRFYLAATCYVAVGLASYFLLVSFPRLIGIVGDQTTDQLRDLVSQPLLGALFLTVLLPKIPLLSDADNWIRTQLQKMGAIPYEARRLSAELRRAAFHIPPRQHAELRKKMLDEGFAPDDIRFEEGQSLGHLWMKISALILQVEEWEGDRRFVGFMARSTSEFDALKTAYRRLSRKAKSYFRLERNLALDAVQADEMVIHYQNDFMEQCGELFRRICDFISRGLLQCGPTYGARAARLLSLGFDIRLTRPRLTLNQLMLIFGVVGITMLSGYVLIPRDGKAEFNELLARAAMISVIYSMAVTCAVYPKENWPFARRDPNDVRPVAFYFVAGAMAAGLGLVVSFFFNSLILQGFAPALEKMKTSYPWMAISFATAFVTAWLIDDQPSEKLTNGRLRGLEALSLAAVLAVMASFVHMWIVSLKGTPSSLSWETMLRAAVVGAVIGYFVPTWYREAPRAKAAPELEVAEPQAGMV